MLPPPPQPAGWPPEFAQQRAAARMTKHAAAAAALASLVEACCDGAAAGDEEEGGGGGGDVTPGYVAVDTECYPLLRRTNRLSYAIWALISSREAADVQPVLEASSTAGRLRLALLRMRALSSDLGLNNS